MTIVAAITLISVSGCETMVAAAPAKLPAAACPAALPMTLASLTPCFTACTVEETALAPCFASLTASSVKLLNLHHSFLNQASLSCVEDSAHFHLTPRRGAGFFVRHPAFFRKSGKGYRPRITWTAYPFCFSNRCDSYSLASFAGTCCSAHFESCFHGTIFLHKRFSAEAGN